MKFTRYANLSKGQEQEIINAFCGWQSMKGIDIGQAVSIAAHDGLKLTTKQWNSKIGADAFAAALATLLMKGAIEITIKELPASG